MVNFLPLDDGLFIEAPEPKELTAGSQYGDYSVEMRAHRASIRIYNKVVVPNIKKSSRNRDIQISDHNEFIDEFNDRCNKLHEDYAKVIEKSDSGKFLGIL